MINATPTPLIPEVDASSTAIPPLLPTVGQPPDLCLTYQLTFADYTEAQFGRPMTRWHLARGSLLSIAIFLIIGIHATWRIRSGVDVTEGRAKFPADLSLASTLLAALWAIAPYMAWLSLMFLITLPSMLGRLPDPWRVKKSGQSLSGWRVLLIVAACTAIAFASGAWLLSEAASWFEQILMMLATLFLMVLINAFNLLQRTIALPRLWARQRLEQLPKVVEIGADGILFTNSQSRVSYRWPAFAGFKETGNLIVLYLMPGSFYALPKRAIATHEQWDRLKQLVSTNVPEGAFLPGPPRGFTVGNIPFDGATTGTRLVP